MANISCNEAAGELLRQCLAGEQWTPDFISILAADECSNALFRILIEGLADRFEPRLCDVYADIFCRVLERCSPELSAEELRARYERVRRPRVCDVHSSNVVVLSRVTLGADIAVTSVILDAVKRRFPDSMIYLAGSEKSGELFAGDQRVRHLRIPYARSGTVRDRVANWAELASRIQRDTIVVDPDSRLTQLGLLPLGEESRYFFFESRAYASEGDAPLSELAARWAAQTFQVDQSQPYIAPLESSFPVRKPCVSVSLGTGGNIAKSLPQAFEKEMIHLLCSRFADVIVDEGAGEDELARVRHAIAGTTARTFRGSFAEFSAVIEKSDCYVGYDSAGQHAAAALGVPLLTLFKGFASDRMFARWQPTGPGPKQILKLTGTPPLDAVRASLDALIRMV